MCLPSWTEAQLREAFWKTFHKSGDIFFDYLGSDEENEESTKNEWEEFFENLTGYREAMSKPTFKAP